MLLGAFLFYNQAYPNRSSQLNIAPILPSKSFSPLILSPNPTLSPRGRQALQARRPILKFTFDVVQRRPQGRPALLERVSLSSLASSLSSRRYSCSKSCVFIRKLREFLLQHALFLDNVALSFNAPRALSPGLLAFESDRLAQTWRRCRPRLRAHAATCGAARGEKVARSIENSASVAILKRF